MKKVIVLFLLLTVTTGCVLKKDNSEKINQSKSVDLGKGTWVYQLQNISIKGTTDYFKIIKKVKWEIPKHEKGETVSFSISIPYIIHVDGVDYEGEYLMGSSENSIFKDDNPKYKLEVVNLTSNYEIKVLVTNK